MNEFSFFLKNFGFKGIFAGIGFVWIDILAQEIDGFP
jgi:hypothetical protein